MSDWTFLNQHRVRYGHYGSDESLGFNGLFEFALPGEPRRIRCLCSDGEEFRPISGYEGLYEISNIGRVKALPKSIAIPHNAFRMHGLTFLSHDSTENGYARVSLCNGDGQKHFLIHVLVAKAFIENPNHFPEVNHRNGNKKCNIVSNLEWCSSEYNHHHAIENGLRLGWSSIQIDAIKAMSECGLTSVEIADRMNSSRQSISDVVHGRHRNLNPDSPSGFSGSLLWQHVSISFFPGAKHTPSWELMCRIKDLFWEDEDVVVQFHPPKSQYVNNHAHCLHLWRSLGESQPIPPSILVGLKELGTLK